MMDRTVMIKIDYDSGIAPVEMPEFECNFLRWSLLRVLQNIKPVDTLNVKLAGKKYSCYFLHKFMEGHMKFLLPNSLEIRIHWRVMNLLLEAVEILMEDKELLNGLKKKLYSADIQAKPQLENIPYQQILETGPGDEAY